MEHILSPSPSSQAEPDEPQGQEKDEQGASGSTEPMDLLVQVVSREELFQLLEKGSMQRSVNKMQLTLDHCRDFHHVLNSMRVLVGEGKVTMQCNAWTYKGACSFCDALYIHGRAVGLLLGTRLGAAVHEAPAKLADHPPLTQQ